MNIFYVIVGLIIALIIFIGVGTELSANIDDTVIYLLFWFLYGITFITFINICLSGYYYLNMKDKTGVPGQQGPQGERGDSGEAGKCDPNCRDSICQNEIEGVIMQELRSKMVGTDIKINNIYLKNKVKEMCSSPQFKQLAPYNGPYNLINYLKEVWKIWTDLLFEAGGLTYFNTIGAEMEWEWVKDNPFNEIMKYDVFYWGMDKNYNPLIVDKCYLSNDGVTPMEEEIKEFRVCKTNIMDFITTDAGSKAYNDVAFYRPKPFTYNTVTYYPVGDVAIGPSRLNENILYTRFIGGVVMPYPKIGVNRESVLVAGDVVGPLKYDLIWSNRGYSGQPLYIWRPIAPKKYMALGDVVTTSPNPPQTGNKAPIRCVREIFLKRKQGNGQVIYSSNGSDVPLNLNILGFVPNIGVYGAASDDNAYNLFRGIVGYSVMVPESDVNANFYTFDKTKYDVNNIPGKDQGRPSINKDANRIGKGFLPLPRKDSKYSILAYLDLKNQNSIVHENSGMKINAEIIGSGSDSNSYFLKVVDKCLNNKGGTIKLSTCNKDEMGQFFSIIFTGNKRGQCRLKETNGEKFLYFKNNKFQLVDLNDIKDKDTTMDVTLFLIE